MEGEALVTISYNDDDDDDGGGDYFVCHCVCVIVLAVVMWPYLHLPSHNGKTIVRERHITIAQQQVDTMAVMAATANRSSDSKSSGSRFDNLLLHSKRMSPYPTCQSSA